ncbi:translation initiation factor eIF4G NDAI_0D02860 [Naumovozyma dairenensis CBS 421]|uniref:MIF4G domain-containing protein n=1 Tax=Naumovozyma dairenensis (strain ATCC 10597 / BCRC 20456 / CBS 421 / NBRC 0211 / NRRL Y-12639) TaxID=1071378 RepID=G0W9Y9_NAUDC|nr:hypothetical protein NDAI_0D02860 [Naumovozyma dairenensis CBS 421]CCD24600.1 hypothetical protein NDAI_0D02860 [Naumovozyma dairenensis CBS 421]
MTDQDGKQNEPQQEQQPLTSQPLSQGTVTSQTTSNTTNSYPTKSVNSYQKYNQVNGPGNEQQPTYSYGTNNNNYNGKPHRSNSNTSSNMNGNYYKQYQPVNGNGYTSKANRYNNPKNPATAQYYNNKYNNIPYNATQEQLNALQWKSYYGSQMMYMPQQMMSMANAQQMPMSPPSISATLATPTPVPSTPFQPKRKIEITTKSGERLDLKEIHQRKVNSNGSSIEPSDLSKESTPTSITQNEPVENPFLTSKKADTNENNTTTTTNNDTSPIPASSVDASNENDSKSNIEEEEKPSAEETRKLFLEQVRLRKESLERKKKGLDSPAFTPAPALTTPVSTATIETHPESEIPKEIETDVKEDIKEGIKEDVREEEDALETPDPSMPSMTFTELLEKLKKVDPIKDIYAFNYSKDVTSPDIKYKSTHVKYTYGPEFLLQFKDKINVTPDDEWKASTQSKIVIPPPRGYRGGNENTVRFGGNNNMTSSATGGRNDMRNPSMRNMDSNARINSRTSSKRNKSMRRAIAGGDDRRSNTGRSSYTPRRDRERTDTERYEDRHYNNSYRMEEKPKEEVAPFVPSANRWIPKSRVKKTEKKFAPDGVTELLEKSEVESKMKSLLNKLTLEKFDTISNDILAITEQSKWEKNGETLNLVIEQIFLKACDEPHWSSMYAQLCGKVVKELDPEIKDETNEGKTGPKLVLHYLVARCHTEFQKGWTDKLPTNEDGSPLEPEMMSDEYYQAASAKRRGLGLVRFIGFLYRLNLLTGKMMFECFRRLIKDLSDNPSEEILESVVELLMTVGKQFEHDTFRAGNATLEGCVLLDSLFQIIQNLIDTDTQISSRIKFKLLDVKELREKKHWNSDKQESGPKTIQQIHQEEEKARQLKMNSRTNSRRMNTSSSSNSHRQSYRKDYQSSSKDRFASGKTPSSRYTSKQPIKEKRPSAPAPSNMFDALMDAGEE